MTKLITFLILTVVMPRLVQSDDIEFQFIPCATLVLIVGAVMDMKNVVLKTFDYCVSREN